MNVNNKKLIDLSCDCKNQLFEEKKNNITPYENYLENQKYLKFSKSCSNIKKTRKKSIVKSVLKNSNAKINEKAKFINRQKKVKTFFIKR